MRCLATSVLASADETVLLIFEKSPLRERLATSVLASADETPTSFIAAITFRLATSVLASADETMISEHKHASLPFVWRRQYWRQPMKRETNVRVASQTKSGDVSIGVSR